MNCTYLNPVFPHETKGTMNTVSSILIHSSPVILSTTYFIIILIVGMPKKSILPTFIAGTFGFVLVGIINFLIWRLFDSVLCDDIITIESFRYLVITIFPIIKLLLLLLAIFRNFYITSTFLSLVFAAAVIVTDYYVRNELSYKSAQTLFPAQVYLCCFAFCCLFCGKRKIKYIKNVARSEGVVFSKSEGVLDINSDKSTTPQLIFDPLSKHPNDSRFPCAGPATRAGNFA
tara:strand:- start:3 stop:695 length:693 start_codon:yes stop_codon:yes gene_type:complete